ncbi:PAP2 family protein [Sphingobacteriales bacterium UPWRP_1]|nr:hypothetical protein B6N25_13890 [Sphingobacteriales bacterium TSM_CSS]PSJ76705.1 PAP2 family protein [Sphingobacteriales bacterium UPWRP_1]
MKYFQTFIWFLPVLQLWLLMQATGMYAQQINNPYRLKWQLDVPLSVGGAGGIVAGEWLNRTKRTLSPDEIALLQVQDIKPRFDRFVTRLWHPGAQKASDVVLYGAAALPLVLLADAGMRRHTTKLALIGLETYLVNAAITTLTKELVQRRRPFVYNPAAPMNKKTAPDATSSFFSGHTSATAAASFMTAKMYADYHPHSRYKPYVWAGAALLPAATAYLRIRGGKHYVTDVVTGYLVGAAVGMLVPQLHK